MAENKTPKTNGSSSNPAEEAENEAQKLIDSLKLDAQVPSSEEVSDLSDVISNLQLDLPTEQEASKEEVDLDLPLESSQQTEEPEIKIDESVLNSSPQEKNEEINIDLDLSVAEPNGEETKDSQTDLPNKDTPTSQETATPTQTDDNVPSEKPSPTAEEDTDDAFQQQALNQEPMDHSEEKDQQSSQTPSQEQATQEKQISEAVNENPTEQLQQTISSPQTDPFEKETTTQNSQAEEFTNYEAETQPSSPEPQQQLDSLESLVENDSPKEESLSLEEEIPTSLEQAYESENKPTQKRGLPKGVLIGAGLVIVLIGWAVVFMASMPDVIANLLNKQKDTVSTITQPTDTHPLQAQTGEITDNNIEDTAQTQQLEETRELTGQNEQDTEQDVLTAQDLQTRLTDLQQLMDEVEFQSTKDKIRAKVLQKKISALIDEGDLQKADYLLNQLEALVYGN